MDNSLTKPDDSHSAQTFEQLVENLKAAVSEFQHDSTPEKFAKIVTAMSGFGLSGAEIWTKTASYAKRNPVQAALAAGLVFFAVKGLVGPVTRAGTKPDSLYH